jgi:succinate-acetate transporter protein
MGTMDERRERASAGVALNADTDGWYGDFARPRVILQPIAAPSVLGLFGFAGATFVVAAHVAGWYGNASTVGYLFPFAAFFGGLAQFTAGMWSYRARDAVATAMHGMWGSFWMAYGLLNLLVATGTLATGATMDHALGFWFIALGAITISGTVAVLLEGSFGIAAVLGTLAAGCAVFTVGLLNGSTGVQHVAGWVFVVSAALAWYMATAMMLSAAAGRPVLPLLKKESVPTRPVELEFGEPGIKQGQ